MMATSNYADTAQPDPVARLETLRANSVAIGKLAAEGRAAAVGFPLLANHYESLVYRQMDVVHQIDELLRQVREGAK